MRLERGPVWLLARAKFPEEVWESVEKAALAAPWTFDQLAGAAQLSEEAWWKLYRGEGRRGGSKLTHVNRATALCGRVLDEGRREWVVAHEQRASPIWALLGFNELSKEEQKTVVEGRRVSLITATELANKKWASPEIKRQVAMHDGVAPWFRFSWLANAEREDLSEEEAGELLRSYPSWGAGYGSVELAHTLFSRRPELIKFAVCEGQSERILCAIAGCRKLVDLELQRKVAGVDKGVLAPWQVADRYWTLRTLVENPATRPEVLDELCIKPKKGMGVNGKRIVAAIAERRKEHGDSFVVEDYGGIEDEFELEWVVTRSCSLGVSVAQYPDDLATLSGNPHMSTQQAHRVKNAICAGMYRALMGEEMFERVMAGMKVNHPEVFDKEDEGARRWAGEGAKFRFSDLAAVDDYRVNLDGAAAYLAGRLGADAKAWEFCFTLGREFTGSYGELADAVVCVRGS